MAALGLALLALAGCGGGGGEGGSGSTLGDEVAAELGYQSAEGTPEAPVEIGNLSDISIVLYQGKVGDGEVTGGKSYYLVQGATPGVDYTVTMTNLTDDADVFIYQGDPTYTTTPAERLATGTLTEAFTMAAQQDVTALYAVVDGLKTVRGAKYTLSVLPKPLTEGTLGSPIDLYAIPVARAGGTVGNDPLCCEVGKAQTGDTDGTADSYYKVTVADGVTVLVSLGSPTADVDLYLSEDPEMATFACSGARIGAVPEACSYMNSTGSDVTLYIAVDGHYAPEGAAYTLYVNDSPHGGGSAASPCTLGAAPGIWHQGNTTGLGLGDGCGTYPGDPATLFPMSVTSGGQLGITATYQFTDAERGTNSYYKLTSVIPGRQYRMTLEDSTDQADLYVYDKDNSFSTPVCEPPYDGGLQVCDFTASGNNVYAAVDGYYSVAGAVYKLTLFPAFVAEGSASVPEALDVGSWTDVAGTVFTSGALTVGPDTVLGVAGQGASGAGVRPMADDVPAGTVGDSYYTVPVTAGAPYRVSLISLSGDVNLYVYNDSTFATPVCRSYRGGLTNEVCYVRPTGDTLYVAVDGYFARTGAAFRLQVEHQELLGENAPENVGKPVGGAPYKFRGNVVGGGGPVPSDSGATPTENSYYSVYVSPGTAYRVTLVDFKGDLDLYVRVASIAAPSDFTAGTDADYCERSSTEGATEFCIANNDPGYKLLLIGVDGSNATADTVYAFTVVVEETKPYDASGGVIELTPLPYEDVGSVSGSDEEKGIGPDPAKYQDSYYSFTPSGDGEFRIAIAKLSRDANLYVFGPNDTPADAFLKPYPRELCPNTLLGVDPETKVFMDEYCDIKVKGGVPVYFAVDGAFTYGAGAKYYVQVKSLTGGSAVTDLGPAPVSPTKGSVSGGDSEKGISPVPVKSLDSYYQFSVAAKGVYRVSMIKLSQDANLYFFGEDSTWQKPYSTAACPNTLLAESKFGWSDEYCDFEAGGAATLYLAVDGAYTRGAGASYYLQVEQLK